MPSIFTLEGPSAAAMNFSPRLMSSTPPLAGIGVLTSSNFWIGMIAGAASVYVYSHWGTGIKAAGRRAGKAVGLKGADGKLTAGERAAALRGEWVRIGQNMVRSSARGFEVRKAKSGEGLKGARRRRR